MFIEGKYRWLIFSYSNLSLMNFDGIFHAIFYNLTKRLVFSFIIHAPNMCMKSAYRAQIDRNILSFEKLNGKEERARQRERERSEYVTIGKAER